MDQVIVTAKMIREARERREAESALAAFNLSRARPLKELMAESRARKEAAAAAAAAASAVPAPVAAPAPAMRSVLSEERESINSLGQWSWRRFGGNEIQGQDYQTIKDSSGKYFTTFKIKGVKEQYPGYWPEWSSLYGKTVVYKTLGLSYDSSLPESEVKVLLNGDISVKIPGRGTKEEADTWLEQNFGSTLMDRPEKAVVKEEAPAPAPVAAPAAPAFMTLKERNAEKKNKVKEAVIEAAKNAQKVYDENKNKKNYYTGQIGINERHLIGKAEEAIRSANSSKGGGTFISLTDKEFKKIVSKYYPKYYD